jgi:hypothetical protein
MKTVMADHDADIEKDVRSARLIFFLLVVSSFSFVSLSADSTAFSCVLVCAGQAEDDQCAAGDLQLAR